MVNYSGCHKHVPLKGFFCLFKLEFSWMSLNCFHGFPHALTDRVPSSLNEHWMEREDLQERRRLFKSFFIRWRITLLKQRVLCKLHGVAETFSRFYKTVSQVVYLFHSMKTQEPWTNCQEASINSKKRKISHRKGKKFPLNGHCFRKWSLLLIFLRVIVKNPELARTQTSCERVLRKLMWL